MNICPEESVLFASPSLRRLHSYLTLQASFLHLTVDDSDADTINAPRTYLHLMVPIPSFSF